MPHPRHLLLAATSAALLLTGCGGRDDVFETDRPIVRFELGEYRIAPQNVRMKAGEVKFQAKNVGRLPHNLVIEQEADDPDDEPIEIGRLDTLQNGESTSQKIDIKPGTYTLICTIANHDDLGQYGELRVEG